MLLSYLGILMMNNNLIILLVIIHLIICLIYFEESVDFEKEINTVPLEDSLNFSDNKSKRAYLIYILKKDFISHIKGLQKAIKSQDTETSHYAAAALVG